MNSKVRNAHIKWLRGKLKEAEKDACKLGATEATHKKAMSDFRSYTTQLARAVAAKAEAAAGKGKKKGKKKKGRK